MGNLSGKWAKEVRGIFLLILLSSLLLLGCNPEKRIARKCEQAQKRYELAMFKFDCPVKPNDSTTEIQTTKVIYRDTTVKIYIPGDTVEKEIKVTDTLGIINSRVSHLETKFAISDAWVENGTLKHNLRQRRDSISTTIPSAIQHTTSGSVKTVRVPYIVKQKIPAEFSQIQKICLISGYILWSLFILIPLYWLIKRYGKTILKFLLKL